MGPVRRRRHAAFFGLGPQSKKSRPVPAGAGNQDRDFGEITVGLAVISKALRQHHDAVTLTFPFPDKDRARFDPARQHDLAVRLRNICLAHLIEQALRRPGEAAVDLLLNPMRDAAPEQIRTERLRRIAPKHFPVANAQAGDRHRREPVQFGLDCGIDGSHRRVRFHGDHRA
jgi:hypothetical protein